MTDINFTNIPANFSVPGQYGEFDPSQADQSVPTIPPKILLIGQMLGAGTAVPGIAHLAASADDVGAQCGRGSQLHRMAQAAFASAPFTPIYFLPLQDAANSSKSKRTVLIGGAATVAGEIDLYVGGDRYAIGVAIGATAASVATSIAAVIAADPDRYLDAAVDGMVPAQVDLTARHAGADAGYVDVSVAQLVGESVPLGLTVTIGALTVGTLNPDLTAPLAALGEVWYTHFVMPYGDAANLAELKGELTNRFGPIEMIDAYAFKASHDDYAALIALPPTLNSPLMSILAKKDVLTPSWRVAADVAGLDANDPSPRRPRQTLQLTSTVARRNDGTRFSIYQRNALINAGISTLKILEDGTVTIERLTTTYRTNKYGITDKAYFDAESMHVLANIRYSWRVRQAQLHPRDNLGVDGSIGDNVVTPSDLKGEAVAIYQDTWMPQGWVQGGIWLDYFVANVDAEINSGDPDRADLLIPPKLIDALRIQAADIRFIR